MERGIELVAGVGVPLGERAALPYTAGVRDLHDHRVLSRVGENEVVVRIVLAFVAGEDGIHPPDLGLNRGHAAGLRYRIWGDLRDEIRDRGRDDGSEIDQVRILVGPGLDRPAFLAAVHRGEGGGGPHVGHQLNGQCGEHQQPHEPTHDRWPHG